METMTKKHGEINTGITVKPKVRQRGTIPSEVLWQRFEAYFAERKIDKLIVKGEYPKGEIERKKAHFVWYMDNDNADSIKKMFLYISPLGNICLPENDAKKIGLVHMRDYNIKGYSTHEFNEVLVAESKYYTNFTELLDKLVDLHEIG